MQARKTSYLGIGLVSAVVIGAGCSSSVAAPTSAGHARVANAQTEQRSSFFSASLPALAKTDAQTSPVLRDGYQRSLARAYSSFKDTAQGKNADYIPALAKVDPKLFGIALAT